MTYPWEELGFPIVDLPSTARSSPDAAIQFLVGEFVRMGLINLEHGNRVACQVLHREQASSTALSRGIALPHSKTDVIDEVLGIVGRSLDGIVWPGAVAGAPVCIVCLLVTPASKPGDCLRALETVVRRLRGDDNKTK